MARMTVTYRVRGEAAGIEDRAKAIAVEQSVEMPLDAITDEAILRDIVGEVQGVSEVSPGLFEVRVGLAVETMGPEAGHLLTMLFGNTSLHDDVILHDVDFPAEMLSHFGGPSWGVEGMREQSGAKGRAMTCTALKPQGMSVDNLAKLAGCLARGGLDFIKDDHGIADQHYSPFAERISECLAAIDAANDETGFNTRYVPSITGDLDQMRAQITLAIEEGIEAVMIVPMVCGLSNFHRLVVDFSNLAFFAHPSMGGSRIAPPLLFGKIFRLLGADVTIYTGYGGRFSYSPETCKAIADAARNKFGTLAPCLPSPAGGMTLDRVDELLDFYGHDTMLLIGGSLLQAKERMTEAAAAFQARVARHYEEKHG